MSKFKVGDRVRLVKVIGLSKPRIGMVGMVTDCDFGKGSSDPGGHVILDSMPEYGAFPFYGRELELIKEEPMKESDVVAITVGQVRAAAEKCETAKDVLKTLCPEVFEEPRPDFLIGDVVEDTTAPENGNGIVVYRRHDNAFCVEFFNPKLVLHDCQGRGASGRCEWYSGPFLKLIHRPSLKCEPK